MKYSTILLRRVTFLTVEDQKRERCGLGRMPACDETALSSRKIPAADWTLAVDLSGLIECHYRMHREHSVEKGQASEDSGASEAWSVLLMGGSVLVPLNSHPRHHKAKVEASQALKRGPHSPSVTITSCCCRIFLL